MHTSRVSVLAPVFLLAALRCAAQEPTEGDSYATVRDFLRRVADRNFLPADDGTLAKLSAESSVQQHFMSEDSHDSVFVLKLEYRDGKFSRVRGAHDNGPYYVLLPTPAGYRHVGTFEANGYTWERHEGKVTIHTGFYWGASQCVEAVLNWEGGSFQEVSSVLVEYNEDGSKRIIKTFR